MIQHRKASFGDVFKVFFALTMSAIGVSQTSAMAPDANKAEDSAASIFEILDSKPEIDSISEEGTTLSSVRGDIEFQHVSFKYPTQPDIQIFKDLCLSMPSGKVLFTQANKEISAHGKTGDVAEEEIISATRAANAHNFISGLPQEYDTNVRERERNSIVWWTKAKNCYSKSNFERSKDTFARRSNKCTGCLVRAYSPGSLRVMVNRTTIVGAHCLTTIMGTANIAVVKNGVIVEKGSHDVLVKMKDGVYASLVALHSCSE